MKLLINYKQIRLYSVISKCVKGYNYIKEESVCTSDYTIVVSGDKSAVLYELLGV